MLSEADRKILNAVASRRSSIVERQILGVWIGGSTLSHKLEVFHNDESDDIGESSNSNSNSESELLCTCVGYDDHFAVTYLFRLQGNNVIHMVARNGAVKDTFVFDADFDILKSCKHHVSLRRDGCCLSSFSPPVYAPFKEQVVQVTAAQKRCLDRARTASTGKFCGLLCCGWESTQGWMLEIGRISERLVCIIKGPDGLEKNGVAFPSKDRNYENAFTIVGPSVKEAFELVLNKDGLLIVRDLHFGDMTMTRSRDRKRLRALEGPGSSKRLCLTE
jgi:hypothetical protein